LCSQLPSSTGWGEPAGTWRLGLLVAVGCIIRLGLEAAGVGRGPLDAIFPLSFLSLMAGMSALSLLGVLRTGARYNPS
jgi:hypothetical protein